MNSNDAMAQGFIPYPYTFPAIKFEVSNCEKQPECDYCGNPAIYSDGKTNSCGGCNHKFPDGRESGKVIDPVTPDMAQQMLEMLSDPDDDNES